MMGLVPVQLSELAWQDILSCLDCFAAGSSYPAAGAGRDEISRQLAVLRPLIDGDEQATFDIILKKRVS